MRSAISVLAGFALAPRLHHASAVRPRLAVGGAAVLIKVGDGPATDVFLMFRDFVLQCRRQSAYLAYCEDSRDRNSQGEPFDIAVKPPRENERGLQCRVHETMLVNRNENGFETHGVSNSASAETSRNFAH